jgi:Eukaryotic aspartyl protease
MKDRQFNYHNVIEKRYYSVNLNGAKVGDRKVDTRGFKAVIDSGTSVIVGPKHLMAPLLEGISVRKDCSGLDELPEISFIFDDTEYKLSPQDYVLKVKVLSAE